MVYNFSDHASVLGSYIAEIRDEQVQKDALRRCRSGGCIAPAKKGANQSFLSGR